MAQQTICPACGAPLEYTGQQDVVRCGFCGAEIRVTGESGHEDFQIVAQPDPQKEVLSKPVAGMGGAAVSHSQGAAMIYPEPAPVAADASTRATMAEERSAGAAIYPGSAAETAGPGQRAVPAAPAGVNRWLLIGLAVILALCAVCACTASVITYLLRNNYIGSY